MAYFAEINLNNLVLRVVAVDDLYEENGQDYLANTCGLGGTWIQTSYNTFGGVHRSGGTPLRKNYAGIGYKYDAEKDAFIPPKPYVSWVLNEDTCLWEAPTPKPESEVPLAWDETTLSWIESQAY